MRRCEPEDNLVRRLREEMEPRAVPPNSPGAALEEIDEWEEKLRAIVNPRDEEMPPPQLALSADLESLIKLTNYLAVWSESLELDSSALVQFAHDARSTYFGIEQDLPPVSSQLWVLLERLRYRLQSIQPKKGQQRIPTEEANIAVRKFLKDHPGATSRQVATGVGIAHGRISQMEAWRTEQARRSAAKTPTNKRSRPLTKKMLEAIGKDDDPLTRMAAEEAVWRRLLERAQPEERARLHAMPPEKQKELIHLAMAEMPQDWLDPDDCS
jgi:hypothetical protein